MNAVRTRTVHRCDPVQGLLAVLSRPIPLVSLQCPRPPVNVQEVIPQPRV